MSKPRYFIIIDDEPTNNAICTKVLQHMYEGAVVRSFTDPEEGLNYIAKEYSRTDHDHTAVLFLDLRMPIISGWEFLDMYDKLDRSIKDRIKIYILSSSVSKADMDKAKANKNVVYYLVKPLTRESIGLAML